MQRKKGIAALICGMLGCICYGAGDWLMIYGNTTHQGTLYWLTEGVAQMSAWRNTLAMALAFPGIVLYGIGLFYLGHYIKKKESKRIYCTLTTYGLTPWMCLHLFYIMIFYLFAWMSQNGYADAALPAAEALFSHLSWIVIASEIMMVPPFIYWFYLQFSGRTIFPKWMAFTNILIIYGVLYFIKSLLPDSAFRIGFTNGLMSESMFIWFAVMLIWTARKVSIHGSVE